MRIPATLTMVLVLITSILGDDVRDFRIPEIPAEPFLQNAPTEAMADRLHAVTLFGKARFEQRRGQFPDALQLYQRAWRYDRSVVSISNELIPLAMGLKRTDEAGRYAGLAIEDNSLNSQELMRIAVVLGRSGNFDKAVQAYQMILKRENDSSLPVPKALILAELGRTALLAQKNELAASAFDKVNEALKTPDQAGLTPVHITQLKGTTGAVFLAMNQAYQSTRQFKKARAAIERANQAAPNPAMHSYRMARLLLSEEKYDEAQSSLQQYFDSKSLEAKSDPYQLLINIHRNQSANPDKAVALSLEQLQKIHQSQISNHYLGYTLAELALKAGQPELSLLRLRQLLPLQPVLSGYQTATDALLAQHSNKQPITDSAAMELIWLLGTIYSRSRSLASLQQDRLAQITSDDLLLRRLAKVAFTYVDNDQIPENTNVSLKTFTSHTAAAMALLFSQKKDWQQAEKFFKLAIEEAPGQSGAFYETWGIQLLMNDERTPAIEVFETALKDEFVRNKPAIHYLISGAYLLEDQNEKAIESAKFAADQANNNPRLLSRYPWVLYHTGQWQEAKDQYSQLVEKLNGLQAAPSATSLARDAKLTLSIICQRLKQPEQAVEWLEQVLDVNPEDAGALNDLGYLWADRNEHLNRALQMTRRAVSSKPSNSAYRDSLGWAYYRLGKYDKAKSELEAAQKLDDSDGVIYDHLGDTHLQLGSPLKARKMWERALELLDKEQDAKQIDLIHLKIKKLES